MKALLQRVGNSQGVIIPKPIIEQMGLERELEIEIQADAIVIRKPKPRIREGWVQASRTLAKAEDDGLIWPEFANEDDRKLTW